MHGAEVAARRCLERDEISRSPPRPFPSHLIIAFTGGNDPAIVLEAAQLLQGDVDAVDLNFGCPQNIARRGRYGAFLQDEWDIVSSLLSTLHAELEVPVTCKVGHPHIPTHPTRFLQA